MQKATLRLLHDGGAENAFQLLVHLAHLVSGGCRQHVEECGRRSDILTGPGEGGELSFRLLLHHGLACLQC
jgi:hypothetical protein